MDLLRHLHHIHSLSVSDFGNNSRCPPLHGEDALRQGSNARRDARKLGTPLQLCVRLQVGGWQAALGRRQAAPLQRHHAVDQLHHRRRHDLEGAMTSHNFFMETTRNTSPHTRFKMVPDPHTTAQSCLTTCAFYWCPLLDCQLAR